MNWKQRLYMLEDDRGQYGDGDEKGVSTHSLCLTFISFALATTRCLTEV